MALTEKSSRSGNNVTDLNEVRQSKERAKAEALAQQDSTASTPKDHGNRRFDHEKVERIKAQIASGNYVIDPARIADRFIEHERNQ